MTETYRYDAFGTLTSIQSRNENGMLSETKTALSRFLYAGEQYDTTIGLYYLRARQYDTMLGRFTQEDTYLGDGRNLYVYVRNNPLKYVDPSGHCGKGLGYNAYFTYFKYNPDSPQIGMVVEVLVDLIPEEVKRDFTQGLLDNFWPVEMEVSSSKGITGSYAAGWFIGEIIPGEDLLTGHKDIKRGKKAVKVAGEIIENADDIEGALDVIKHTDGKVAETIGDIADNILDGGKKANPPFEMDLQFFANDSKLYKLSPKHDPISGWGSPDIIPDIETGQQLLDAAYSSGKNKQLYNFFEGQLIKFQPDVVFGWHAYTVINPAKEVPIDVLRKMLEDGVITPAQYKNFIKNKMR